MTLPLYIVDAFAERPFTGNPAAVCLLDSPQDEDWMQALASEMNLSETAFVLPVKDGYRLRWFTPRVEVDLCGHATLASAHILYETGRLEGHLPARFYTRSGLLVVHKGEDALEMDFPAVQAYPCEDAPDLAGVLGVKLRFLGRNGMDYLVEVADEAVVRQLTPDLAQLATLPVRGMIVTARSATSGVDFVSRFFAPRVGVPEDPVTGSAHCALGPYWSSRLQKKDMVGYQVSARGGKVRVRVCGDRVHLGGKALTVLRGTIERSKPRNLS